MFLSFVTMLFTAPGATLPPQSVPGTCGNTIRLGVRHLTEAPGPQLVSELCIHVLILARNI